MNKKNLQMILAGAGMAILGAVNSCGGDLPDNTIPPQKEINVEYDAGYKSFDATQPVADANVPDAGSKDSGYDAAVVLDSAMDAEIDAAVKDAGFDAGYDAADANSQDGDLADVVTDATQEDGSADAGETLDGAVADGSSEDGSVDGGYLCPTITGYLLNGQQNAQDLGVSVYDALKVQVQAQNSAYCGLDICGYEEILAGDCNFEYSNWPFLGNCELTMTAYSENEACPNAEAKANVNVQ